MSEHPSPVPPRTPAAAQPPSTYKPTPDEEALIRLSQEWMHVALVEKDERRLRSLMAPEFTLQIWDASLAAHDLDTWMHTLLHRLAAVELKYTSLSARVFGDIGIVYSAFWWKGTMDGQPFTDAGFMADVWSRQSGSWQVVARRSAPLQQVRQLQTT
jgi:Domain of unknown function (DUF4440)